MRLARYNINEGIYERKCRMEKLMIILMIAAIIALVLCAIFLLIKIFKMIDFDFDFSSYRTIEKSDFDIARENAEKERIERDKEAEERENWKPHRDRVFVPSLEFTHGEEEKG